jgi:hypothetical protein
VILTKSFGRILFACSLAFLLIGAMGCGDEDREEGKTGGVWFIHATDPHVFLYTAQDQDKDQKAVGEAQQKLDDKALSDMLQHINSLPPDGHPPAFIVLTGDLGIEPCSIATVTPASGGSATTTTVSTKDCVNKVDTKKRADQVDHLAELLGESPVRDIYIVAGNNDIPNEDASDDGLIYFNSFLADVEKKIAAAKKDVHLHNLSQCYVSANGNASDCVGDIPNTSYRMIGFPSYTFKNHDTGATNLPLQEKQFATFKGLLDDARKAGKKVLVVSHIPEMEDPFTLAQQRYAGKSPSPALDKDAANPRDAASTWNVSRKLLDDWESVLASDTVAGVLAGHLHDSHREIYRQPYDWSKTSDQPRGFHKLYLAPPLSVKNQDTSPIQARGFSLVHLTSDRIELSLYWYNSEGHSFQRDESTGKGEHHRWFLSRAISWFWQLADSANPLDRMAILLIAFLAAFLTVVQIWQIPPGDNPSTDKSRSLPSGNSTSSGGAQTNDAKPAFTPSPFASNFGKTVIAGLGGLAAETVLQSLGGKPTPNDKEFYIVWFILFFFALLILMAAFRGAVEGFRARFTIIHYAHSRGPKESGFTYWLWRMWDWVKSLQVPFLTFSDTLINLIQGKNQTNTLVFSNKIVEQQRNVVRVAETIRKNLNELIFSHLARGRQGDPMDYGDVRVNISVLSSDFTKVFYIASAPGSAVKAFPKSSVAWISVFTGKIRWYKSSYRVSKDEFNKIILFDNKANTIPDDTDEISLSSHYQLRDDDYKAFVVFPVPWPSRGFSEDYVKGAIQISFRLQSEFESLWKIRFSSEQKKAKVDAAEKLATEDLEKAIQAAATHAEKEHLRDHKESIIANDSRVQSATKLTGDPVLDTHTFSSEELMLSDWCTDDELRVSLLQAIKILGELLRGFNENIYRSSGGSN